MTEPTGSLGASTSILVVEDSPTQAERLRLILERKGHGIAVARNGIEALVHFERGLIPSLVISDIVMPEMNGYELCSHVKKEPSLRHIPVILLTSLTDPSDVMRGLECGADNFIFKPYEEEYLLARVAYVLANRHLRETDTAQMGLQIHFAGATYFINSDRLQILNLLLSTYEAAIEKNRELAEATSELEAKNLQLAAEIAERTRIEQQLVAAKEEAERANSSKSEFLSHMSHELRTPLNAVIGFAQLLQLKSNDPMVVKSAGSILDGGRHLLNLINEVLDIARIEAGRLTISMEPVEASSALSQALELVDPIARDRGITVIADAASFRSIYVSADRLRLIQVVLNLLTNAAKYNRPHGEVRLTCEPYDGGVKIVVADTGRGIDPKAQAAMFEPFVRGDNESEEGTGLGLALSRRLVTLMGGTLELTSTGPEGSTFVVDLRAAEPPVATGAIPIASTRAVAAAESRMRVVCVEDNAANMDLMIRIFEAVPDTELIPAMDGETGLQQIREQHPDLVILDLHLPDIQGHEVLRELKGDPGTRNIPVIILSADATEGQVSRLLNAGAAAYLTKPIDIGDLFEALNTVRNG